MIGYLGDEYPMTSLARASLPIALFALLAGCKNNNIKADSAYTTETVGAEGSTLTLDDGASVYIPSKALAEDHDVTLGRVASSYPPFTGPVVLSSVYSLEPHDLMYQKAVTISIPGSRGSLFFAPEHGSWMTLNGMNDGQGHPIRAAQAVIRLLRGCRRHVDGHGWQDRRPRHDEHHARRRACAQQLRRSASQRWRWWHGHVHRRFLRLLHQPGDGSVRSTNDIRPGHGARYHGCCGHHRDAPFRHGGHE